MFYVSQQESQMKKSLLFLPLLGLASNVAAQELHGVVTDADNNYLYAKTFPEHEKNVAQADATRGK